MCIILDCQGCVSLSLSFNIKEDVGLPLWLSGKESACKAGATGDMGSIPGPGRSPGGEHGNPLQYSCLENPTDRGAWWVLGPWGHKELDMTEAT